MRRLYCVCVGFAVLGVTTFAHAVSPEEVAAVAERPVTIELSSGDAFDGEVLSQGATEFVVLDSFGMVHELRYTAVSSVRVRGTAGSGTPSAGRERAADYAGMQDARERHTNATRPGAAANLSRAGIPPGTVIYPRLFFRGALSMGYGAVRGNENSYPSTTALIRGVAFGGDFALGMSFSPGVALHANFGVRRLFAPAGRVKTEGLADSGFSSVDARIRAMNVGLGMTFNMHHLVMSASLGAAQNAARVAGTSTTTTQWGLGGDVMLGFAMVSPNHHRMGIAVAATWMVMPRDADGYKESAYSIGPRFFFQM